jgi:CDP-diacylglycerol--glycerol-3-phosphate 3-phosphatidyltransferase
LGYKTRPVRVVYKTMTLATRITIGRILMIPFFIGALLYYQKSARDGVPEEGYRWAATFIFFLAAVSDAVDGIIARRWNQRSRLGAILDPLADKALMLSAIITLSLIHIPGATLLPIWFLVLVLARDFLLITGVGFVHFYVTEVHVQPHWTGKVTTFFQMAAIGLVLLQWAPRLTEGVILLAGIATGVSAVVYLVRGVRFLSESDHSQPE